MKRWRMGADAVVGRLDTGLYSGAAAATDVVAMSETMSHQRSEGTLSVTAIGRMTDTSV
jgi:hypothetical protein